MSKVTGVRAPRRLPRLAMTLALLVLVGTGSPYRDPVTATAGTPTISPPDTPLPAGTYCNQTPTQPTAQGQPVSPDDYNGPTKVLQIFEENESAGVVDANDNNDADFELNTLGGHCGVLANMHGETHGSETNYLDDTDGGNNPQWTLCDAPPNSAATGCAYAPSSKITAPNIFSQVESKDGASGWRVYGQSQTSNCQSTNNGVFVVRHNAPQFYNGISCAANDIPAGSWQANQGQFYNDVVSGSLPAFTMYTPNNTDDGHDPTTYDPPSVNVGNLDTALSKLMALIQSGPDYQSGNLIVMVTFDEGTTTHVAPYNDSSVGEDCTDPTQGETKPSCQILTYIVGRYVPWQNDGDFSTHYSMLKTTQEILGLTPANGYSWLGHAGDMLTNDFYYQFMLAPNSWSTGPVIPPSPPTVPSAPTAVHASAGSAIATVSFTAPASSGGSSIGSYTVASSPGGITATAAHTPITVSGLTSGTSYTFTVTATNSFGSGPPSGSSNAVTPSGAVTGSQLLPDPGFESGNGGWAAFTAGTLTRVTTPVHSGTHALQVASPNSTVGLIGLTQTTVVTSSVAGRTYTASCYVRPTAANLNVLIRFLEYTQNWSSNVLLKQTSVTSLPTGAWTLVQVSGAAVNSGERIIPQIYSTNETSKTGSLIYDDCSVIAGTPQTVTVPGPPSGVSATAGDTTATVSFTPPASNGGAPITGYLATSSPAGITAMGTASPITVPGLTNGVAYVFTVAATNSAGTGAASAPSGTVTPAPAVTVPDAPTIGAASAGDTTASVTFTPPASSGGAPITAYTVTSNPGPITATGNGSPITVNGLTDATAYTFTVTAANSAGTGAASAPSNSVIPTATPPPPPTAPDAPTIGTATAGDTTATVGFSPPANDGGAAITGYTVTSSPGAISAIGSASPIDIVGLTDGTSYTFTVTATNSVDTGPPSAASNAVTPAPTVPVITVPDAPTSLTATAGNAQVGLSWSAPISTGGAPIIDYLVQYHISGPALWTTIDEGSASTTATVPGLVNGTSYEFMVTAVNSAGASIASSSVAAVPKTVPDTPTAVVAAAGNASAVVSFTAPAISGGASITSYSVTSSPGNVTAVGTASPITVSGLANGTSYTFTVTATNTVGAGPPSGPSNAVTPSGVTTPPQLLPDPGFESGNGGWVAFTAGTLTRVTTPVHGGSHALQVASPNSTVGLVGLAQNAVITNSVAGRTYTTSCYVRPSTANLNIVIRFLEYTQNWASNVHLQQTSISSLQSGVWTKVQVSSAAVKSGERIIPQIYSTNETSKTGSLVYDDCSVSGA